MKNKVARRHLEITKNHLDLTKWYQFLLRKRLKDSIKYWNYVIKSWEEKENKER